MLPLRHALIFGLAIGLVGVVAALSPGIFALEESMGLHLLFWMRGPRPAPTDVVIVALDRQSSKRLNLPQEPRNWPRSVHARLIDRLKAAGASVIVFDLIFHEPQTDETDARLAKAIKSAGNVILAQSIVDETIAVADSHGAPTANISLEKMVPPIAPLARAALAKAPFPVPRVPIRLSRYWTFKPGSGDVPTMPVVAFYSFAHREFDALLGAVRRLRPFAASLPASSGALRGDALVNAIRGLHDLLQQDPLLVDELRQWIGRDRGPGKRAADARRLLSMIRLSTSENNRYLNFYGAAGTVRTIPYYRLMRDSRNNGRVFDLRGKAVFVGQTESYWPKAKDGFFTVYAREDAVDIAGVEIAATAFANLAADVRVEPLAPAVQVAVVFLLGFLFALVGYRLAAAPAALCVLGIGALYLTAAFVHFNYSGVWYPLVVPLLLLLPLSYFSALIWKYRTVSQERRTIREAFGYYLPNQVVDQLARNIQAIHLARKVVYSICLFTDAEKYTNLSERMDPESLTEVMNQYYQAIFRPIREHGGVVLQVIGDSVLSIWTAPEPDTALRSQACRAALAVADAVAQFNRREGGHPLPTRIGLHAGYVLLGNIGAMDHFEYRPVGDIVNTASRLEGLNKYLGTSVLASEAVVEQLPAAIASRCVGRFVFVGKSRSVKVFELTPPAEHSDSSREHVWSRFAEGLTAFEQQNWQRARAAFQNAAAMNGSDGPSQFYTALCDRYRRTPPGDSWDGAVRLDHK